MSSLKSARLLLAAALGCSGMQPGELDSDARESLAARKLLARFRVTKGSLEVPAYRVVRCGLAVKDEDETKLQRFDKVVAGESVSGPGFGGGPPNGGGPGGRQGPGLDGLLVPSKLYGLLAAGVLRRPGDLNWQALALLALLVDPLWGSIWRLAGGRQALLALPPISSDRRLALPYLQMGSPAARLLAGDHTDVWPSALRVGVPAVVVALLVAALLGTYAIGLTLLVVVLAALGWTLRRTFGRGVPLLQSIVAIGLPWALTLQQVQHGPAEFNWLPQLVLIGCWILHQWGGLRNSERNDLLGLLGLAAAEITLCLLLIVAQAPLWLAPLVILLLPTWLLAYQRQPLRRLRVVWLAAMLISAIAMGQTVGL